MENQIFDQELFYILKLIFLRKNESFHQRFFGKNFHCGQKYEL